MGCTAKWPDRLITATARYTDGVKSKQAELERELRIRKSLGTLAKQLDRLEDVIWA